MRHGTIPSSLFKTNRKRLVGQLAHNSLAVINANDIPVTNADGTLIIQPNADLFYLTGIEQEESILLIAPEAADPKMREILFLREPSEHLKIWEGHKHSKQEASKISGISQVKWLSEFDSVFRLLMCEVEQVYLNSNEHKRASVEVETRDARFIKETQRKFPLHNYRRLARVLHELRPRKNKHEVDLIQKACGISRDAFKRVLKFVKPGVNEMEIEAEFAHEFVRNGARFAYTPIIASGENACTLHYLQNDQKCKSGELLLLDVGAAYANYASDMTRTIPVKGRFTKRQKQVYKSVLRALREVTKISVPGMNLRQWQKDSELIVQEELLKLGLIKPNEVKRQPKDCPALKKYFMHGIGHSMGIDVHDVNPADAVMDEGWVLTVEPGIYIPEEGFGVRLENDILVTGDGPVDLMADIPIEADEIEALMKQK